MELHTFSYTPESGWSIKNFPNIDSSKTVVFIFGAQEYYLNQTPMKQLIDAYPQAKIVVIMKSFKPVMR